jgi:hypothetical protein
MLHLCKIFKMCATTVLTVNALVLLHMVFPYTIYLLCHPGHYSSQSIEASQPIDTCIRKTRERSSTYSTVELYIHGVYMQLYLPCCTIPPTQ